MKGLSRAAAAALAGLTIGAPPALAQLAGIDIPYPAVATSEPVVQAWIDRYLPTKGYVVGAWSANVVMLVSVADLQADRYPEVTTEVLSEVLRPRAADAAGWRASAQTETFDCDKDTYRVISSLYFARGDRRGGFDQDEGETVWHTPDKGATMDTVERAACFYGKQRWEAALPAAAAPPRAPPTTAAARRPATPPRPASVAPAGKARHARVLAHPVKAKPAARAARPANAVKAKAAPLPTPSLRGLQLQ